MRTRLGVDSMPYVWAKVKTDYGKSSRRLDQHGFDNLGEDRGENVLFRKPGLEPNHKRERGWSLAIPT